MRKRLSNGFSIGGIYTFSKSIDDASSIGAGATSGSGAQGWVQAERALPVEAALVQFRGQRSEQRGAESL